MRPRSASAVVADSDGDAADARDLGAAHRLQVGDDRERLGLGGRERGRAGTGEQAPRGLLRVRVGREDEAAADPLEHEAAAVQRALERDQRVRHGLLGGLQRVRELLDADRLGREEQQRLDPRGERERRVHAASTSCTAGAGLVTWTVISPNGSSCSHEASPRL